MWIISFKEEEEENENKSAAEQADHSESEDSSSRKSSTGKDFEMVEASLLIISITLTGPLHLRGRPCFKL